MAKLVGEEVVVVDLVVREEAGQVRGGGGGPSAVS